MAIQAFIDVTGHRIVLVAHEQGCKYSRLKTTTVQAQAIASQLVEFICWIMGFYSDRHPWWWC